MALKRMAVPGLKGKKGAKISREYRGVGWAEWK